jgi:hypothetical protein
MATPVRIVRPKKSGVEVVSDLIFDGLMLAIRAWIVMLLAPLAGFTPGYWTTVGLVYAARCVIGSTEYRLWTSEK